MLNTVTVSAKTLDEAITKGCAELGVGLEAVDFEIVDQGGVFRKMQVKVSLKAENLHTTTAQPAAADTAKVTPVVTADTENQPQTADNATSDGMTAADKAALDKTVVTKQLPAAANRNVEEFEIGGKNTPKKNPQTTTVTEFNLDCPKFAKTLEFATAFFGLMGDNLTVTHTHDDHEFLIQVQGADDAAVSRLIGKEGKTLAAINTVVSAIAVNTHSGEPRRVVVDIENYREKRKESLVALAKRKAEFVKMSGKAVKLDPMPARERVVVHMALQDVEGVITQSEGVEPHRRLVIKPGAR